MNSPKLYFGHPINVYNTDLENELLRIIKASFVTWVIENPASHSHEEAFQERKARTGNGMGYFFEEVIPKCAGGIFLPFRDGKFGAGVFEEAELLAHLTRPVYQITPEGIITSLRLDESLRLTVSETKSRIRTTDGKLAPY